MKVTLTRNFEVEEFPRECYTAYVDIPDGRTFFMGYCIGNDESSIEGNEESLYLFINLGRKAEWKTISESDNLEVQEAEVEIDERTLHNIVRVGFPKPEFADSE